MTSSGDTYSVTVVDEINKVHTHVDSNVGYPKNRQHRHILRSKENTYKHKCNKLLKKKLKKYKLRQDGTEDPEVLDVSQILISSLIIKSPNNIRDTVTKESDLNYLEELRPKNYLFKMVRRKEAIKIGNCVKSPNINIKQRDEAYEMPEPMTIQEKKHMNAFKLLMDSRNKSIGSNSPGKDRCDDQSDSEEMLEKKNTKTKRKLILQKLAEAKGYLKNKEMDEFQDKIIKRKMDKRAERLKNMILKETKPPGVSNTQTKVTGNVKLTIKDEKAVTNNNESKKSTKAFKIVDIFNTLNDAVTVSPEKKHIPEEDKEFLNKLSPSLKKKESMLSYFKKVDKEPEIEALPLDVESDDGIIKVKLQLKTKKKGRKKKLSLKRDTINLPDSQQDNDENNEITCDSKLLDEAVPLCNGNSKVKSTGERQKRKRSSKLDTLNGFDTEISLNSESRPKRSIKRPVKYTDDVSLSSSDEDLHIFTPKKKKHVESLIDKEIVTPKSKQIVIVSDTVTKKDVKDTNTPKKAVKLAPIFASKQLDPVALEAKQKFLQSGVPEKLKKLIQQQKNISQLSCDFPTVVHVQQRNSFVEKVNQPLFNVFDSDDDDICPLAYEKGSYKKLLIPDDASNGIYNKENVKKSIQTVLQNIKQLHPKFPVYRTYRYLKGKGKGELQDCNINFDNSIEVMNDIADMISVSPDKWNWTDKYKAISTNHIIGNFESIKELRKWLISWTENEIKSRSKANNGSDSSDYYQSDTDSRDSFKTMNNLLILTGPTGSGKTSSVYAVAADLAMKVIEVNASSKRTGKIMLQDLQEATQSHKVNRGTSTDNSQKSQEKGLTESLKNNKKRGRPKKSKENSKTSLQKNEVLVSTPSSQESTRTDTSLILIDDADIVFDQDDGFSSAIVQLVQCSKRPVILITSSTVCPHLQRFFQTGKILKLCPLMPRLLGTWLDIMCLADSGIAWPGVGAKFLNYFKGDIRKTINYLQFYISNYAYSINNDEETQNIDSYKANIDDENSSMSWADHEDLEGKKLTPVSNSNVEHSMWTEYVDKHLNLTNFRYPLCLFDIWWSVPRLLNTDCSAVAKVSRKSQDKGQVIKELESMADAIDAISLSDYMNPCSDRTLDITSQPWYSPQYDSVSELDNVDYYMNKYETNDEICHTIVTGYITAAQETLNCDRNTEISFPGMSLQRQRDKVVACHKSLTTYLSPWAILDRRSLALDYWSSCRTICRTEKCKNDANVNVKRNNRFCHYLKSLYVLCKSDTFDNLCDSLANEGTNLNITNIYE